MTLIHIAPLSRNFLTLHRRERLGGAFGAVTGLSFDIEAVEITGAILPNGAGNSTKVDPSRVFCAPKKSLL